MASLQAETIFEIGPVPVTNSLITATVVTILIVLISLAYSKISNIVSTRFTGFIETAIEFIYNNIEGVAGKKARNFFPLCATFFIFIILNSWFALLPFVGPIGVYESHGESKADTEQVHVEEKGKDAEKSESKTEEKELVPIFRSINADINGTLVLALISVAMTHLFAIQSVGLFNHIARYLPFLKIRLKDLNSPKKILISLGNNFINLFVGLLEIVSEFVKIISLSFRLFGNIFAGEVVLGTVSGLLAFSAFIIPIPFIGLEILVGYVQATVFMLLTVAFMNILTDKHGAEEHH